MQPMSTATKLVKLNGDGLPSYAVRHYTVAEVAALWRLSDDLVRKLFAKEPGVLVIGDRTLHMGRRRYTTLRIPEPVVERVHQRLLNV
jgi:hypothetical protein